MRYLGQVGSLAIATIFVAGGCHTAADSGFAAINIKLRLIAALQRAPATSFAAVRLTPVPSVLSERRLQ